MVSKKIKLIFALSAFLGTASFAQDTTHMMMSGSSTSASWAYDSSKISSKNLPQYNEFNNYQTPYPPKPRSMWELGFAGGNGLVVGDRSFLTKKNNQTMYNGGFAGGVTVRKAFSNTFSVRGGYYGSIISIPGYKNYQRYVKNYTHMLNLELVASLNTISPYRGNPKTNLYVFGGYSAVAYSLEDGITKSHLLAVDRSSPLNSQSNLAGTFGDFSIHTPYGTRKEWGIYHAISTGAGFAFKLSKKVNIALEERFTIPLLSLDNLDGYVGGKSNDFLAYSVAKLNFNLGSAAKHVQPLWWVNPNNYIYNEVSTPKHMKMPPVVLPDADGDGVTDQFDMEPNTPAGCAVDVHGVSLDTDGDGVPDCRDKEKLTPQNCFPVNADGVGTCPEPECCKAIDSLKANMTAVATCSIGSLPSVQFKKGSSVLNATAKSLLNNVAQQLMASPNCKVKLVGYGASNKKEQQLSWDHVSVIKTYLTEKQGISESRVIFTYGMEGSGTSVDLIPTTEEGPNTVPAPHPNLHK